ncbi:MAG TPA: hypothetical protein PKC24_06860 [Cyclobacteriaceae bacterium]|nr:hypothetical protein [Cyclobacteriaceae bacterium]
MAKHISKSKAESWTRRFQQQGKGAKSVKFSKEEVLALLNQQGCEGLRIYNAFADDNAQHPYTMFLVGTTADGSNLLPAQDGDLANDYQIWNDGMLCPPNCPDNDL